MTSLEALLPPTLTAPLTAAERQLTVRALALDAREVTAGALFAAWRGQTHDGHQFLAEARARGAVAALVQAQVPPVIGPAGLALIPCADPRRTLARAARLFFGAPDQKLELVAITGTNGKTTCAQLVATLLAAHHGSAASLGTLGRRHFAWPAGAPAPQVQGKTSGAGLTTEQGAKLVASLADLLQRGTRGVALEASSIALDQGRLDGLEVDVAAWTNLTQDHLDYHGDMASYRRAKERLFAERLRPRGWAVLNADDPAQADVRAAQVLAFSAHGAHGRAGRAAQVYCQKVTQQPTGLLLQLVTPRGALTVRSPLVGAFNVENLLLTVAVAEALGLPHATVQRALGQATAPPGRLQRVVPPEGAHGASLPTVVVDYAHTPDALTRVLTALRPGTAGRLWCLFGCGGDRDRTKRAPMGAAVAGAADVACLTSDNPRNEDPARIAEEVVAGLLAAGAHRLAEAPGLGALPARVRPEQGTPFFVQLDRARAIQTVVAAAAAGDTVLLAGKGHETTQQVGAVAHPFDDAQQARQALLACVPPAPAP